MGRIEARNCPHDVPGATMPNEIDANEIFRDIVSWMDGTDPGWRGRTPREIAALVDQASAYLTGISRRYRIPESDFMPSLRAAANRVRAEHAMRRRPETRGPALRGNRASMAGGSSPARRP